MTHSNVRSVAGSNPRRLALGALLLPAVLALAACGTASVGSGAPNPAVSGSAAPASPSASVDAASASASTSPSASVAASPSADDPCSLVTADEAEAIVGAAVTPQRVDSAIGAGCGFVPTGDQPRGFLNITIRSGDAADDVEAAINELGFAEIPGLGDAAAGVPSTVIVKTGDTVFTLSATDTTFAVIPVDTLSPLAQTVVERLGGSAGGASASPSDGAASPSDSGSPSPSAS